MDFIAANERSLMNLRRAIVLSQGQFSLVLTCCNYEALQERMLQRLLEISSEAYQIEKLVVPPNTTTLYTKLHLQVAREQSLVLMVLGLESVYALDDLLTTINHVRDEFRKRHHFPMVFWVNDKVLQKIVRLAPDFASWAATPIRFELTTEELLEFLQQKTDSLFAEILNTNATQQAEPQVTYGNRTLGLVSEYSSDEFLCAVKDLQNRGIKLDPELNASLEFVFGLDDYVSDRIDLALEHFQQSLQFWHEHVRGDKGDKGEGGDKGENSTLSSLSPMSPMSPMSSMSPYLFRYGIVLFHIGSCYFRLAERHHSENPLPWLEAKSYFQQCLDVFEVVGREEIVAQCLAQLSEVLEILHDWEELQKVATKSLDLHRIYGTQIQLACDYSFLAEVAMEQLQWEKATQLAQASLSCLAKARKDCDRHLSLFPLLLKQISQLVLAQALLHLGEKKKAQKRLKTANRQLETALESSDHRYDAHRYIRLLRKMRSLYFESGQYLEAFCIRQKRRSVEQQYGLRAFIGAGRLQPLRPATKPTLDLRTASTSIALEIDASGRKRDIDSLIGRISRPDRKLTIIHGQSGVGKSSTVTAGLVPALQNRAIGDQIAVPVVLRIYTHWVRELGKSLTEAQLQIQRGASAVLLEPVTLSSENSILEQLQKNAKNHLITVLIFDQFEEFFFSCPEHNNLQHFDKFICDCLNIPFVKIIFSLREDYLHRLLEFKHLAKQDQINNNILDKNIRYQLKNFAQEDAKNFILKLTERSHFYLEPALIDAVVQDLSTELGEVRPIELQVVGSQLQDERITTLREYQQFTSGKLIERYIQELIKECGPENERAALLVLYLLTDENKKRPYKTYGELASQLAELEHQEKLELVLEILVRSGLVVLFPDQPERRYQLIHDYLVDLIRYLQQAELNLQTQLQELRSQVQQRETEIYQLKSQLKKKQQQFQQVSSKPEKGLDLLTELKELRKRETQSQIEIEQLNAELQQQKLQAELAKSNRSLTIALAGSVILIVAFTTSFISAFQWRQALVNEIRAISATSEVLLTAGRDIDALKEGLKAGRKQQNAMFPDADTRSQVMGTLYQLVFSGGERASRRLQGHSLGVNSVNFSPDGKIIASAGADSNMILWHTNSQEYQVVPIHADVVNNVSFSHDGKTVASASQDTTVKLWNPNTKQVKILAGHQGVVNSVSFTPDDKMIASASSDRTIKLWHRDGKLQKTLLGHKDAVLSVAWSPNGQTLASASTDKTINLWSRNGNLLKTIPAHNDAVRSVAWSPDGRVFASASLDKSVKLWSWEGKSIRTFTGHNDKVTSVTFTPDGQILASASTNKTINFWSRDRGILLRTFKGHGDWVNSVNFSPDGKTLASGSRDTTVKLWKLQDLLKSKFEHHTGDVTSISFSPQGDLIASAGLDKTVRIWNSQAKLLHILKDHKDSVWGVSFSPKGDMLASASTDTTVKLWKRDGTLINTLSGHKDTVLSVSWSPQNIIASGSKDKTVKLWSQNGSKLSNTLSGHEGVVNWVSFSPNGELLASASDDKTVKLWSSDGKLLKTLSGHRDAVYSVAWSPDGSKIASASEDNTVKLWSSNGKLLKTLWGHRDAVTGVSFSRDGELLASVSEDKTVKLWNREGVLQISLKEKDYLTSISLSSRNKAIAFGSASGTVFLRNLEDITLQNLLLMGCDLLKDSSQMTNDERKFCPD
nr:WD40 repeat domain-containing protein [Scytonema sp. UIC 10036]